MSKVFKVWPKRVKRVNGTVLTPEMAIKVALRNRINKILITQFGNDWLRDFVLPNGLFYSDHRVEGTKKIIKKAYEGLLVSGNYTHTKLLSEMEFGVWKFIFNNVQYRLTLRCLLEVFPYKPRSTA